MAPKKKAQLTDDIFGDLTDTTTVEAPKSKARATLNLTVDETFKWEVKEWATRHRMTVVDAMKEGFALMQEKHGK